MASFHFKLQPVLRQRELAEEQCQRELAMYLRKRMILHDQLRGMQQTISTSKRELGQSLVGKVDLARIGDFARYSGQVTQRAYQIVTRLRELEPEIAAARQKLVEASRRRKAIQLLRDRQHQQWLDEQNRAQTLEMDELATQRFVRSTMEAGR